MKYSVIIPVYNAEKTLHRCVDSLLMQNCQEAEIILVNDGSKDSSGSICEEYAANNHCIRYISKKNGGVSSARNAGMDAASGDYILFVDSDDYVTEDFFSAIERNIQAEGADWIQFSYCFDNGREKQESIRKYVSEHSRKALLPHISDAICRKGINSPWAKLYRRDIIESNQIRFPEGVSVAEDKAFNIVYSFFIKSYAVSEDVVYIVNTENEGSLSRKRHRDLQDQFKIADSYIDNELSVTTIADDEKDCYRKALNVGRCRSVYHDAKLLILDGNDWISRQKLLMKKCKEINRIHMKYPQTLYCTLITLPVRMKMTCIIDAIALRTTGRRPKETV